MNCALSALGGQPWRNSRKKRRIGIFHEVHISRRKSWQSPVGMGFFTTPPSTKKRKREEGTGPVGRATKKVAPVPSGGRRKKRVEDEEISSDDEDETRVHVVDETNDDDESEDEFAGETVADKRRRLALQYLENTRAELGTFNIVTVPLVIYSQLYTEDAGFNAEDIDRGILAERLKEHVAEDKGRIYRHLADAFSFSIASHAQFSADTKSTTGIAACYPYIYTISKDRHVIKWRLPGQTSNAKTPKQVLHARNAANHKDKDYNGGHIGEIIAIAASQDGKFVATGGKDNRIVIWDPETLKPLRIFKQHRSPVIGLVFRRNTNQMYSCSADRTVKSWSLDELAYVETLFGHQDEVVGITALAGERCVTVGARDRTARLWKIVDETQLIFRAGGGEGLKRRKDSTEEHFAEGSLDCVTMIDEEHFVTGSDNGYDFWFCHNTHPPYSFA